MNGEQWSGKSKATGKIAPSSGRSAKQDQSFFSALEATYSPSEDDQRFEEGLSYYQAGQINQAIELWEAVLQEQPNNSEVAQYLEEARSRRHLNEMTSLGSGEGNLLDKLLYGSSGAPEVEEQNSGASGIGGESVAVQTLFQEGERLYHGGQFREARAKFEHVLLEAPSHSDAYFLLELCKAREADQREMENSLLTGMALQEAGDWEGAIREMERILEIQPDHPKALEIIEICRSSTGEPPPKASVQKVQSLPSEARQPNPPRGSVASEPSVEEVDFGFGEVSFDDGESQSAQEEEVEFSFDSSDAPPPKPASASRVSARPAVSPTDEPAPPAQESPPTPEEIANRKAIRELYELASKAERAGELEQAVEQYQRILTLAPNSEVGHERIAALQLMIQSRKYKMAFDCLNKAKALSSKDPVAALLELTKALELRPEMEEGLQLLPQYQKAALRRRGDQARKLAPQVLVPLILLGSIAWLVFFIILPQMREHEVTGLLHEAGKLLEQGYTASAEEKIYSARSLSPKNPEARRMEGKLMLAKGQAASAVNIFQSLVQEGVGTQKDSFMLGKAFAQAGNEPKAQEVFLKLLSVDDSFKVARLELAWSFLRQGDLVKATEQSQILLSQPSQDPEIALLSAALLDQSGLEKEALEQYAKAFATNLKNQPYLFRYLELLEKSARWEEAKATLEKAKPFFKSEEEFWMRQGALAKKSGNITAAEDAFRSALVMNSSNLGIAQALAQLLMDKGDVRAAERVMQTFNEKNGDSVDAWVFIGDAQMKREAYIQAVDSYRKAQELNPTSEEIAKKLERATKGKLR